MNGSQRKVRTHTVRGKKNTNPSHGRHNCSADISPVSQTRYHVDVTTLYSTHLPNTARMMLIQSDGWRLLRPSTDSSHLYNIQFHKMLTPIFILIQFSLFYTFRSCMFNYDLILSSHITPTFLTFGLQNKKTPYEFIFSSFHVHSTPCQSNIPQFDGPIRSTEKATEFSSTKCSFNFTFTCTECVNV